MFVFVVGGGASGKSEYAENLCVKMGAEGEKLYIATMEPFGEEARMRIARHHKLREQKGFRTVEKYRDIRDVEVEPSQSVLLECMSTLLANEFFADESALGFHDSIIMGIEKLEKQSKHLLVVSNKIFQDGLEYSRETMDYMEALGAINIVLAARADVVIEVVCGIPVIHKGRGYMDEWNCE